MTTSAIAGWLQGPLHIDSLSPRAQGRLGMTHCPGRCTPDARGRLWQRRLDADVDAIRAAGYGTVVTLLGDAELQRLGVPGLRPALRAAGLRSIRIAVADFGVPDPVALAAWRGVLDSLVAEIDAGGGVLIHCAAGLGRTGMMAATVLATVGRGADDAIDRIRRARSGTIETEAQAAFVRQFARASGHPSA